MCTHKNKDNSVQGFCLKILNTVTLVSSSSKNTENSVYWFDERWFKCDNSVYLCMWLKLVIISWICKNLKWRNDSYFMLGFQLNMKNLNFFFNV